MGVASKEWSSTLVSPRRAPRSRRRRRVRRTCAPPSRTCGRLPWPSRTCRWPRRSYLNRVLDHKDVVPLRRFNGSAGRTPLTKGHKFSGPGRFPEKSVKHLLDILTNAESNAESKELDTENLHITHIQVNQACHGRRRTYRAHGRINAYMSSPCHVEVILTEKEEGVKKADDKEVKPVRKTKKQLAKERLTNGASA